MTQVHKGRDGRQYEVSGTAADIARQLKEIDDSISVQYNEYGEFFCIVQTLPDGTECLVQRVPVNEWDGRVVKWFEPRAWEIRNGVSAADRLEKADREAKEQRLKAVEEAAGEKAYDLMRAIQKDVHGMNPRIHLGGKKGKK